MEPVDKGWAAVIRCNTDIYFAKNARDQHGPWKDLVTLHNRNFLQEIPAFYRDLYAPAEMQSPLARLDAKISYAKGLPERRFLIEHAADVAPDRLGAVVQAVADGGGVIAWSRPIAK